MTASSVGLFPCRVQPIGLPPTAASNTPFNNSGNISSSSNDNNVSRQPPMRNMRATPTSTEVRRVSRNLFGKAERSEIDQIMRVEYARNCAYMRERYCFDISHPPAQSNNEDISSTSDTPLPTLILKEVELQASKRQKKTSDADSNLQNSSTTEEQQCASFQTPTYAKQQVSIINSDENVDVAIEKKTTTILRENEIFNQNLSSLRPETIAAGNATSSQQQQKLTLCNTATNSERHKTNAKQTLITDCFNVRKSSTTSTLQQHTKSGNKIQQENLDEVLSQQRTNANVLLKVQIFKTSAPTQT